HLHLHSFPTRRSSDLHKRRPRPRHLRSREVLSSRAARTTPVRLGPRDLAIVLPDAHEIPRVRSRLQETRRMKNYWLVKSEPDSYSWSDLVKEKKNSWT